MPLLQVGIQDTTGIKLSGEVSCKYIHNGGTFTSTSCKKAVEIPKSGSFETEYNADEAVAIEFYHKGLLHTKCIGVITLQPEALSKLRDELEWCVWQPLMKKDKSGKTTPRSLSPAHREGEENTEKKEEPPVNTLRKSTGGKKLGQARILLTLKAKEGEKLTKKKKSDATVAALSLSLQGATVASSGIDGEVVSPRFMASPRFNEKLDPSKHAGDFTLGTMGVAANDLDLGVLYGRAVKCDVGCFVLQFKTRRSKEKKGSDDEKDEKKEGEEEEKVKVKEPKTSFTLRLPLAFGPGTYTTGPLVQCHLKDPVLHLNRSFEVNVKVTREDRKEGDGAATEGEVPGVLVIAVSARAISRENKNVATIRAAARVAENKLMRVRKREKVVAGFEKVPSFSVLDLSSACVKGNVEGVKACIERGDNVNHADDSGDTPLHKAVSQGSEDVVHLLVEAGANAKAKNKYGDSPLDVANKFYKDKLIPKMRKYY
eukprot:TRINITY_DN6250_c0_g1_i1.p1 TRINITY_DN6250_c0_g1~~TRINITY_DN6250_c0_g1_i1.p1  ORF type:complete len:485 (+),score=150.80 TRINITY_DN6250_c0_g1_i1:334-1788(+)